MNHEARIAAWTLFGTLLAFKLVTTAIVLMLMPEKWVVEVFLLLNWFWFIPPILIIGLAGIFWYRMLRGRARRARMLREEFCVDQTQPAPPRPLAFLSRFAQLRQ